MSSRIKKIFFIIFLNLFLVAISLYFSKVIILKDFTRVDVYLENKESFTLDESYIPHIRLGNKLKFRNPPRIGNKNICLFGDSHAYGSEVSREVSPGYQLQAQLKKMGLNYNVFNFGASASSISKIFFVLPHIFKSITCEFVVLGPSGYQLDREQSFFFETVETSSSRVILKTPLDRNNPKIQPVVLAISPKGIHERLSSLIPSLKQWRFDRKISPFLYYLFDLFGLQIKNPFYYLEMSYQEEETYLLKALIKNIESLSPRTKIIFTYSDPNIADEDSTGQGTYDSFKEVRGLESLKILKLNHFYRKDKVYVMANHSSPLGIKEMMLTLANYIANPDYRQKRVLKVPKYKPFLAFERIDSEIEKGKKVSLEARGKSQKLILTSFRERYSNKEFSLSYDDFKNKKGCFIWSIPKNLSEVQGIIFKIHKSCEQLTNLENIQYKGKFVIAYKEEKITPFLAGHQSVNKLFKSLAQCSILCPDGDVLFFRPLFNNVPRNLTSGELIEVRTSVDVTSL